MRAVLVLIALISFGTPDASAKGKVRIVSTEKVGAKAIIKLDGRGAGPAMQGLAEKFTRDGHSVKVQRNFLLWNRHTLTVTGAHPDGVMTEVSDRVRRQNEPPMW